jgi:hypothetical protein
LLQHLCQLHRSLLDIFKLLKTKGFRTIRDPPSGVVDVRKHSNCLLAGSESAAACANSISSIKKAITREVMAWQWRLASPS